jgi:hypothetical protein
MEQSKMEMVFRHVINGRRIVARQRGRVERLVRDGHDTTNAKRTLDIFARTLDIFEDDLRRILEQDWNHNRSVLRPLLTPEEFEATRKACALTLAGRERVLAAWREQKLETMIATASLIARFRPAEAANFGRTPERC